MKRSQKKALFFGLILLAFLPVWHSGLRGKMSFYEFVIEHTIWGHKIMFVPTELYSQPLTDEEFEKLVALREQRKIEQ